MKKNIKFNIYLFIVLLIFIGKCNSYENRILIKVNNEIITSVDILNEINFLSIINKDFTKLNKNKKIEIAKNSLINEKIKLIEVSKYIKKIDIENKIYENISKSYFSDYKIKNLNELEIFLKTKNLSSNYLKMKISIDTFWKKLIYDKYSKNVKINKKEIKKSIKKKDLQKEYFLSEIVFSIDENEEFSKKKDLIINDINTNSFSDAAFNFSISDTAKNGGELGWIKENILSKKIKSELRSIKKDEFTKPMVIPGGFLILKILDIREIKMNIDLEKEVQLIIENKTNEQLNRLSNIYLKKLKKDIKINEV